MWLRKLMRKDHTKSTAKSQQGDGEPLPGTKSRPESNQEILPLRRAVIPEEFQNCYGLVKKMNFLLALPFSNGKELYSTTMYIVGEVQVDILFILRS